MHRVLAISLLLLARHAVADDTVELRLRSTGRPVHVELRDEDNHACTTPCTLRVPPGAYRARIDGLDRTVTAGGDVVIAPTRYPRLILAASLLVLGATGLAFASHWASPLSDDGRLAAGLAGAALTGFAIPLATSSSARVGGERPSRADLYAGYQTGSMVAFGVGYRPRAVGFGAQVRGRFATDAYQFAIGPTLHGPRIAYLRPALAVHVGFAELRGPGTPANVAMELPAQPGARALRATLELEARVELALPLPIVPSLGMTTRIGHGSTVDAGVHLAF